MPKQRSIVFGFALALLFASCEKDVAMHKNNDFVVPFDAMDFPEVAYPEDNTYSQARFDLGRRLFYEKALSGDSSISCASCHRPELGFSDDRSISFGAERRIGRRNSPTLSNVGLFPYFTREGGIPSLEMQVLIPFQEHDELDLNIVDAGNRLKEDSSYVAMSLEAYGQKPNYYVISRALATFERSLISNRSTFDRYLATGDDRVLSKEEKLGMRLFYSERTNCSSCHSGPLFTNHAFENNGLYMEYKDPGRARLTSDEKDQALFKVPTLRNIALTSPYMHDGSIETLEEVIQHYTKGGVDHPHKSHLIRKLDLSEQETKALVAFLTTLTDHEFINNRNLRSNE